MHILIIEASLSGHHEAYLENAIAALLDGNHKITVALPSECKSTDRIRNRFATANSVNWVQYNLGINLKSAGLRALVRREVAVRRIFGGIFDDIHRHSYIDFVFLPYLDYCLYAIGLLGTPFRKIQFSGICMRPAFHYKEMGIIAPDSSVNLLKKMVFIKLLKIHTLKSIYSIDELLVKYVGQIGQNKKYRLKYLADPSASVGTDKALAQLALRSSGPEERVLLVYGAIDFRKSIVLLLDALNVAEGVNNWHVWIVGVQSPEVRDMLASSRWDRLHQSGRVHIKDEYVSCELEQSIFAAVDVVWIAYEDHYAMSGVLVRAAMNRRPVIGCRQGLIGWYTKTFDLGVCVDIPCKSIDKFSAVLKEFLSKVGPLAVVPGSFRDNTWHEFSRKIAGEASA